MKRIKIMGTPIVLEVRDEDVSSYLGGGLFVLEDGEFPDPSDDSKPAETKSDDTTDVKVEPAPAGSMQAPATTDETPAQSGEATPATDTTTAADAPADTTTATA